MERGPTQDPTPPAPPDTGPDDDPAEAQDVDALSPEPNVDNMAPPEDEHA